MYDCASIIDSICKEVFFSQFFACIHPYITMLAFSLYYLCSWFQHPWQKHTGQRLDSFQGPGAMALVMKDTQVCFIPYSSIILLSPQMPSYYQRDEKYQGIIFFDSPRKQSITSEGAHYLLLIIISMYCIYSILQLLTSSLMVHHIQQHLPYLQVWQGDFKPA